MTDAEGALMAQAPLQGMKHPPDSPNFGVLPKFLGFGVPCAALGSPPTSADVVWTCFGFFTWTHHTLPPRLLLTKTNIYCYQYLKLVLLRSRINLGLCQRVRLRLEDAAAEILPCPALLGASLLSTMEKPHPGCENGLLSPPPGDIWEGFAGSPRALRAPGHSGDARGMQHRAALPPGWYPGTHTGDAPQHHEVQAAPQDSWLCPARGCCGVFVVFRMKKGKRFQS